MANIMTHGSEHDGKDVLWTQDTSRSNFGVVLLRIANIHDFSPFPRTAVCIEQYGWRRRYSHRD